MRRRGPLGSGVPPAAGASGAAAAIDRAATARGVRLSAATTRRSRGLVQIKTKNEKEVAEHVWHARVEKEYLYIFKRFEV